MKTYDVIVMGLGAHGASTLYQLAKRGKRVLGIDRYDPPHEQGCSHGDTRITRLAIGEGEAYSPLAIRSHQIWREIESQITEKLLTVTGGLIISSPGVTAVNHVPKLFENTLAAAAKHGIKHMVLGASAIRERFPAFQVRDDEIGYYEPEAGFLRPERCIKTQLLLAKRCRAEVMTKTPVIGFGPDRLGVAVYTKNEVIYAERLVICAGAWVARFLGPKYAHLFSVRRQELYWFDVEDDAPFRPGHFPVFYWELQGDRQGIYGFPAIDGLRGGIKIATEQTRVATTPEEVDRAIDLESGHAMYLRNIRHQLTGLIPKPVRSKVCLYTVTPDAGFIVDTHPENAAVTVVSACSGHGFKHSAALGEAIAEQIVRGKSAIPLDAFALSRFATP